MRIETADVLACMLGDLPSEAWVRGELGRLSAEGRVQRACTGLWGLTWRVAP